MNADLDPPDDSPAQGLPAGADADPDRAGREPVPPPGWPVLPPEAAARFAEHLRRQRRQ